MIAANPKQTSLSRDFRRKNLLMIFTIYGRYSKSDTIADPFHKLTPGKKFSNPG